MRATYQIKESEVLNQIHGSATIDEAKSEIEYFFPKEQTLAVIKPDGYENRGNERYLNSMILDNVMR